MTLVEGAGWDMSLGLADTSFGKWILRFISSSEETAPETLDHVGILVFGYLYEYGDLGVLKTKMSTSDSRPESKYFVTKFRTREPLGKTKRSREEFDDWIKTQNGQEFRFWKNIGENYSVVEKNCIIWATEACKYLGVQPPSNWKKLVDWAKEHKSLAGLVGSVGLRIFSRSKSTNISGNN